MIIFAKYLPRLQGVDIGFLLKRPGKIHTVTAAVPRFDADERCVSPRCPDTEKRRVKFHGEINLTVWICKCDLPRLMPLNHISIAVKQMFVHLYRTVCFPADLLFLKFKLLKPCHGKSARKHPCIYDGNPLKKDFIVAAFSPAPNRTQKCRMPTDGKIHVLRL